ncbi:MAG TPA: hypothetical protein VLE43_16105 [Candidatus Saccharimonadia bacterium]|nr:hypothetical protein [Candidatus Saccharimonadia bacterium]
MTTVPLRFLVGITRLIAIYFAVRSLDGIGAMLMSFQFQTSMDMAGDTYKFPSPWRLFATIVGFYVVLTLVIWFLAPFICRLALGSGLKHQEAEPVGADEKLAWGEIMIFLAGILMTAWGLSRLAEMLTPILQNGSMRVQSDLQVAHGLSLIASAVLTGLGGLLALRFPSVYRWCVRRKLDGVA